MRVGRLASVLVAGACARTPGRDGVFFSPEEFPGTGEFANEHLAPEELRAHVADWHIPFDASIGALTREQHEQFFEKGWVIVHDLVPHAVLEGAIGSVNALVDAVARQLWEAGEITELHAEAGFRKRLALLERQFPGASVLMHKLGVLPQGIRDVWSHDSLMGVAQQLLGADEDIFAHPVWNLRSKTPDNLSAGQATVPWHQDNAYLNEECWDKLQVTAWVPLVDTDYRNGCMQVLSGSHRSGGTAEHACCVGGTWYIETTPEEANATLGADVDMDVVTCEVPFGSVLFLNNLIVHRSLPNDSDGIRWSLDLRWQRGGEPNGFHGLKDSLLMKRGGEPFNGTVDWGDWALFDRSQAQNEAMGMTGGKEIDTAIAGPWMKRWPLVHENRHTATVDPDAHGWFDEQHSAPKSEL